jgi:hypothetical protein
LPERVVKGLPEAEALELLDVVLRGPLDEGVREQIIAETRGNPLALLELPAWPFSRTIAGGFGLPVAVPLADRIERSFVGGSSCSPRRRGFCC